MKIIVKLLLLCVGYFPLMGMSEKNHSSEWNQNEIDSVCFYLLPFDYYPLRPFCFKFYKDTLFVYKPLNNYEKQDPDYILCQKIVNQDTVNLIKKYVQLFIIDKTENIILKKVEKPDSLHLAHKRASVLIQAYMNEKITYNEEIVLYQDEEYNLEFLELCNLLFDITIKNYSSEWDQNEIDRVLFYYSFNNDSGLRNAFDFIFYKDTLFAYKYVYNYEKQDFDNVLCQKIVNQDTVNLIKKFVQLFIIDKTENIILKDDEDPWDLYFDHTAVFIRAYINGRITYKKEIVIYKAKEYNPKFLQLCDLFLSIARQNDKVPDGAK